MFNAEIIRPFRQQKWLSAEGPIALAIGRVFEDD